MSGKLTAEQVRKAIFNGSVYASYDGAQYYASGISMQAIADELNATLGDGECEVEETEWLSYGGEGCDTYRHTLSCGHVSETFDEEPPNFCCECGARVRKAVKR